MEFNDDESSWHKGPNYPAGFVEPRTEFWSRLQQMAGRAADLLGELKYEGAYGIVSGNPPMHDPATGEITDPDDEPFTGDDDAADDCGFEFCCGHKLQKREYGSGPRDCRQ